MQNADGCYALKSKLGLRAAGFMAGLPHRLVHVIGRHASAAGCLGARCSKHARAWPGMQMQCCHILHPRYKGVWGESHACGLRRVDNASHYDEIAQLAQALVAAEPLRQPCEVFHMVQAGHGEDDGLVLVLQARITRTSVSHVRAPLSAPNGEAPTLSRPHEAARCFTQTEMFII